MSVESRVISVSQLPKFRLNAAPQHLYSCQRQTDDTGYKPSVSQPQGSVQFWPGQQPQNTKSLKNLPEMLQTQECSHKLSSALSSSQALSPGSKATPVGTTYTASSSGEHVQPACSQTAGHKKMKSNATSDSSFSPHKSSFCRARASLIVPVHHESDSRQRNRTLTVPTNSFVAPSTARMVVVQPKKDSSRPCTANSRVENAHLPKESQKGKELPAGTSNVASNSAAIRHQNYASSNKSNNTNSSNSLQQSEVTTLQRLDGSIYRPASQCKEVQPGSVASSRHDDSSVRRIPITLLMQNGSVKSSQFTVTRHVCSRHMSSGFVPAASDRPNTDNRIISRSVTPELQTFQPPVMLADRVQNDVFNHQNYAGHANSYEKQPAGIKIERRVVSNTPMTVCTLPVSRPAFVCQPLMTETAAAASTKPSCSKTVTRSYHETTRSSQRHESPSVCDSGHAGGAERRRSAATTISRLPYVGADLWELTTRRLQNAVIDKASSHTLQSEQRTVSTTGGELSSSSNSPRTPCSLPLDVDDDHNDRSRLVNKCLSAKTIRPQTSEMTIRSSQSTCDLHQNCEEEEEDDDETVECEIEL